MSKKVRYDEWTQVKGFPTISVIGDRDRFSMSIKLEGITVGINGCRIMEGKRGEFISYPAWKDSKGLYHDYTFFACEQKNVFDLIIDMF